MRVKALLAALCSGFFLLFSPLPAYADVKLPDGAVKGLPSDLTAMDNDGQHVNSESGEYFFQVEDMQYGVTYTKEIQLMNLREDKAYHIYFYVEPLFKNGEIDLEKECSCRFWLDNVQFYHGNVSGIGNIDLTQEVYDLGNYLPGDSHKLTCSITWEGSEEDPYFIDNGRKIVSQKDIVMVRDRDGDWYVEGEIEFKWIFYAAVDEEFEPPYTGLLSAKNSFWLICILIAFLMVCIMAFFLMLKKKKQKKKQ